MFQAMFNIIVVVLAACSLVQGAAIDRTTINSTSLVESRSSWGGGFKNVAYYADWEASWFKPRDLPINQLTHILHAFTQVRDTGNLQPLDAWFNTQMPIEPEDNWERQNQGFAQGVMGSLFKLKQENRNLKTILSIGGYNNSPNFKQFAHSWDGRRRFIDDAISMMAEYGMDGIDIDWEYPSNWAEGQAMATLFRELRSSLDWYSNEYANGYHFELTGAFGVGPSGYSYLDFAALDQALDAWHLMTYDFMGNWSPTAGHHANLRGTDPSSTAFNIGQAVDTYLGHGIPAEKLILGIPVYGQAFKDTNGLGQWKSSGQGGGSGYLYKDLPHSGAAMLWDDEAGASYSYDAGARELVSFDTPDVVRAKAQYLKERNMGGSMFWLLSGDKGAEESLGKAMADSLGWQWNRKYNNLCYRRSKYPNINSNC